MNATNLQSSFRRTHVLIVDDDPDALRLLSHHIRTALGDKVELIEEQDSKKAAAILMNQMIDVVVTDLDMADKNGFHMLKTAKSRNLLTQIVIVTAHQSGNAIRSALTLGADEFIVKPYAPSDLLGAIGYLSERLKRWRSTIDQLNELPVADQEVATS